VTALWIFTRISPTERVRRIKEWIRIVNFEENKKPVHIEEDIDILLKDRPEELKKLQETRAFEKEFKAEPIDDEHDTVKALGKDVNLNAVLKQNIDKRSVFTVDNLCDMFVSWRIDQLQKYQKKKRGVDFNWAWLFILIIFGIGGLIFVILILLPKLQGGVM